MSTMKNINKKLTGILIILAGIVAIQSWSFMAPYYPVTNLFFGLTYASGYFIICGFVILLGILFVLDIRRKH